MNNQFLPSNPRNRLVSPFPKRKVIRGVTGEGAPIIPIEPIGIYSHQVVNATDHLFRRLGVKGW